VAGWTRACVLCVLGKRGGVFLWEVEGGGMWLCGKRRGWGGGQAMGCRHLPTSPPCTVAAAAALRSSAPQFPAARLSPTQPCDLPATQPPTTTNPHPPHPGQA
jgi:hypothetical protein